MSLRRSVMVSGVLCSLLVFQASAHAAVKLDPNVLVTRQEAEALLGAPATLEVHNVEAIYPGSADFAYTVGAQTTHVRILQAAFYPSGGAEMFENQRKTLAGMGKKLVPCSAGDACFLLGAQLNARKGNLYFTLVAGRDDVAKLEALARDIAQRLP